VSAAQQRFIGLKEAVMSSQTMSDPKEALESQKAVERCEDCGGLFATLRDGLCGFCDLERLEGMEFDRDRE
jgi:hypothetical protein